MSQSQELPRKTVFQSESKENSRFGILHSSQNNRRTKFLGNSVILVPNISHHKNILQLRKLSSIKKQTIEPALLASKLNIRQTILENHQENGRIRGSQYSHCMSNINILKKQVQMLEEENCFGKIRFSASDVSEKEGKCHILQFHQKNKCSSQFQHRLAKGRAIFNKKNHALIASVSKPVQELRSDANLSKIRTNTSYRNRKQSSQGKTLEVKGFHGRINIVQFFSESTL